MLAICKAFPAWKPDEVEELSAVWRERIRVFLTAVNDRGAQGGPRPGG